MAQWVEQFPSGHLRDYALENLVFRWVQTDSAVAGAWVDGLPAGRDRDTAINAGAGALMESHPDLAAQWAQAIGNETLRRRQLERAARR